VRKKLDPYTPDQLARAVAAAAGRPAAHCVALLASAGCRIGEACALDVGDLDPAGGTIAITKTYLPSYGGIGPPKSPHSVRTVRVPAAAVPVLIVAAGGRAAGPLFLTGGGKRMTPALAAKAWHTLARAAGLPTKNPHQLRHSVATAMIGAGVPLGDVAEYLGDTVETVVKTYVHRSGTDPSLAMDRLFGGGKVGEKWAAGSRGRKRA
jgi:integrase